jgi:hypothetical protein
MRNIVVSAAVAFSLAFLITAPALRAEEAKPVGTDVKVVEPEAKPAVTEAKPAVTDVKPVEPEAKPAGTEKKAKASGSLHRIGLGANYWKTLDKIDADNVDSSGFSYLASYQYAPIKFMKVEINLEYFPSKSTGNKEAFAPEIFVTAGELIYVGAGVGKYFHDNYWSNSYFYMLRAGLDFPIAPRLFLDVNLNYRFNEWHTLDVDRDLKADTVRLGALLRFTL